MVPNLICAQIQNGNFPKWYCLVIRIMEFLEIFDHRQAVIRQYSKQFIFDNFGQGNRQQVAPVQIRLIMIKMCSKKVNVFFLFVQKKEQNLKHR